MGIIETLLFFLSSIFCMGGCYCVRCKYYEQEEAIYRLENQIPPQYQETNDEPAPPYEEHDENTPILPPPIDLPPN